MFLNLPCVFPCMFHSMYCTCTRSISVYGHTLYYFEDFILFIFLYSTICFLLSNLAIRYSSICLLNYLYLIIPTHEVIRLSQSAFFDYLLFPSYEIIILSLSVSFTLYLCLPIYQIILLSLSVSTLHYYISLCFPIYQIILLSLSVSITIFLSTVFPYYQIQIILLVLSVSITTFLSVSLFIRSLSWLYLSPLLQLSLFPYL